MNKRTDKMRRDTSKRNDLHTQTAPTDYRSQTVSYVGRWLVIGLIALLSVACGSATPAPTPAPTESAVETPIPVDTPVPGPTSTPTVDLENGRIVLWHSWAEADGDALAAILGAFKTEYPNLVVDTLFVAYNDLPQSYADAVLAGSGPDLVLAPNLWLGELVDAGVVQPLDELASAETLAQYWPATLDNLRWDGKLYGLPTNFEVVALFYNRSLIAPEEVPTTMNDLLARAQQNGRQGIGLYASLYHLYWGLPAYGAQLLDEQGRVVLDSNEGAAGYLQWLEDVAQLPGDFVDQDYGMLVDRFKKGEYALFVDGPWSVAEFQGALGDQLGVAPLPAGPAGPAQPWLTADGLFLNPASTPDQQQRALFFARYMTGAASGGLLATIAHRLPANRAINMDNDPLLRGFLQQAASAQSMPSLPEMEQVWGYGGDMLIKAINDVAEPQDIVVETTTLINEANGK